MEKDNIIGYIEENGVKEVIFIGGILSERVARGEHPKYEEPVHTLPIPTVESLSLTTCFLAAKK